MVWEVTFAGLQISGRALGLSPVGETTRKSGRDFVSREDAVSEVMNSDSLIHVPGIQNGGSDVSTKGDHLHVRERFEQSSGCAVFDLICGLIT